MADAQEAHVANKVEVADNLATSSFVDVNSRYLSSAILFYGEQRFLTFETFKRQAIPETSADTFTVISKAIEYRPDLLAHRAYGISGLWWKILIANKMSDIWQFKAGVNIRIPGNIF